MEDGNAVGAVTSEAMEVATGYGVDEAEKSGGWIWSGGKTNGGGR